VCLLLTKSRTATFALVAGCAAIAAYRLPRRRAMVLGLAAAWLLSVAVLAASIAGIDLQRTVLETVLIGRTDDALSLTGRIPLWRQLIATVDDRILIGFGWGAFWTPEHIRLASAVVGSGISHAHCAYIETMLNLGIVGLVACLLTACAAVREVFRRCRADSEGGVLFLAALLAFALVHAFAEALFATPSFVPFFAACGLSNLAYCAGECPDPECCRAAPGAPATASCGSLPAGRSDA
jgi:O-antigen ligase